MQQDGSGVFLQRGTERPGRTRRDRHGGKFRVGGRGFPAGIAHHEARADAVAGEQFAREQHGEIAHPAERRRQRGHDLDEFHHRDVTRSPLTAKDRRGF